MWWITNSNKQTSQAIWQRSNYSFYCDESEDLTVSPDGNMATFISGYVSLRGTYKKVSNHDMLQLYGQYGKDLIHKIKGNFIAIVFTPSSFYVFSDHFGIMKFFHWSDKKHFIVSDHLQVIAQHTKLKPSALAINVYALTYHFTGGYTLFEDIWHNKPAEIISLENDLLHSEAYWNPNELLHIPKKEVSIREIVNSLDIAVHAGLQLANEGRISLSLTGGADTRNLLALFLRKGIKPHLYTYGNPLSNDCVIANEISKKLNLQYNIYDISMNADLFEENARRIIHLSGGMASLHRVHRLLAIEKEANYADTMFLGTLGGEYIRGVSDDDYIIPSIVYENWGNERITNEALINYLKVKQINVSGINVQEVHEALSSEPYLQGTLINRKHGALSYITAHLHDAQDLNLYSTIMDKVFVPFLDIDYLELLFSSSFSFDNKELISNRFKKRIENPVFSAKFLNETFKPLLNYKYAGHHKPSEVLFNKYYAAVIKVFRQKISKKQPPNFPLGSWMEEFVKDNLSQCKDYSILRDTFLLDELITDFQKGNHLPKEAYWLKFTTPIMMRFLIEEYNTE